MKITIEEKGYIFSLIKEHFNWCTSEMVYEGNFYTGFHENLGDKEFYADNGAVKYCISSPLFDEYVVKFCVGPFNYCEREYNNYLAAVENRVDKFFPFTDYLGEFNGISFFIQEKADCDPDHVTSIWYESLRDSYESEDEEETEEEINDRIWEMIDDLEDDERIQMIYNVDELVDFLYRYCINDLHQGNFGFIDDRLVIIDFSGYGYRATERSF